MCYVAKWVEKASHLLLFILIVLDSNSTELHSTIANQDFNPKSLKLNNLCVCLPLMNHCTISNATAGIELMTLCLLCGQVNHSTKSVDH